MAELKLRRLTELNQRLQEDLNRRQVLGARLGAHMVMTRGQKLIRPMIVIVSLVMSCKLLYDNHGAEIQQWLALHF